MKKDIILRRLAVLSALILTPVVARSQDTRMADLPPATVGIQAMSIDLTGAAEVPGPGAQNASARAFVVLNPNAGRLCYSLNLSNMPVPNAAHIHAGAAGVAGDPVVNLNLAENRYGGCVSGVDSKLLQQIGRNPDRFYLNVHTTEFPAGAVRGQLTR